MYLVDALQLLVGCVFHGVPYITGCLMLTCIFQKTTCQCR